MYSFYSKIFVRLRAFVVSWSRYQRAQVCATTCTVSTVTRRAAALFASPDAAVVLFARTSSRVLVPPAAGGAPPLRAPMPDGAPTPDPLVPLFAALVPPPPTVALPAPAPPPASGCAS